MLNTSELDLPSGRSLSLQELRQHRTYEVLIEGLPTVEWNKMYLERLLANHRDKPYERGPYLIRPSEKPINYDRGGRRYPFGTPSALPLVTCLGRFVSHRPARDMNCDTSGLLVIWFQEEFAFPIDPAVVPQLLAIDWEAHATDWRC